MIELAEDIENNKSLRVKNFKVCITIVYSVYERYYSPDRKKNPFAIRRWSYFSQ